MFDCTTSFLAVLNDVAIQASGSDLLWSKPLQGAGAVRHIVHRQTRRLASRS